MNDEYVKVTTQLGRPIPGQSLTTDPDNPAPYEKPPRFTSVHEASEFLFEKLIEEETYMQVMELLIDDMPIMDITRTLLFQGFTEGQWSPDLMLMLVEPVAYMLLALAERAQIEPIIYRAEEEDEVDEMDVLGVEFTQEKIKGLESFMKTKKAPAGMFTPEMATQIESLPEINTESLMSEQPEEKSSLLAAPAPTEEEMQ
jgi:hypothetical protein